MISKEGETFQRGHSCSSTSINVYIQLVLTESILCISWNLQNSYLEDLLYGMCKFHLLTHCVTHKK